MNSPHGRVVLATNATSASNALGDMTPTSVARDTVVQTNREGDPLEYREIKTTEKVFRPTEPTTTKTTVIEEVPVETEYVLKKVDKYEPLAVVSDTTPINSANNRIVGVTAAGNLTTPGKIVGDLEPVLVADQPITVVEPVAKTVTKTEVIKTKE